MHLQWAEKIKLPEILPGLTAWTLFPNSYHKKDFVLALVSGRSPLLIGSLYWVRGIHTHKDLSLSNGFFFTFTAPVVTNLGQRPRSLGAEWAISPPIIPSIFCLFYKSFNLYVKSKHNFLCYMYVFVQKTSGLVIKIGQNQSQNW